jgi:hypothetical protein
VEMEEGRISSPPSQVNSQGTSEPPRGYNFQYFDLRPLVPIAESPKIRIPCF